MNGGQSYCPLICLGLMEAPNHAMGLRDIYKWFNSKTDQATDDNTKAWKTSIRHNLSMNPVRMFDIRSS
jgi:hypothetical protein